MKVVLAESLCEDDFLFIDIIKKLSIIYTMEDKKVPQTVNEKELETLAFWQKEKIFEKSVETPGGDVARGDFSFYDGPPFATGLPHHGHILAGTIKDAIPRYHAMQGKRVRRVWGWDCHGLPVENLIEKKLKLSSKKDIEEYGVDKFNHEAFCSVLEYESEWKKIVPRLGRFVDMSHPYKTMDATYTESVWWSFAELHKKGLVYEGDKMMHICPRCETPLAQSEVGLEYHDVTDLSVTAEFELKDEPGTYVLAWTTTPWTLPGNTALAVHKDILYVKVKSELEGKITYFILAKSKVAEYFKESTSFEVAEEFKGETLVGKSYEPVFPYFKDKEIENKENIWKIWHADFITEDAGTGIAHEAPAFGAEDMDLAKAQNIPVIKHVKMDGTFTGEVLDFAGMKVKQKDDTQSCDIEIIKWLAHNGKLFEKHKIVHSYPLCWRCKTPLLNYATSSWFVDVPKMKDGLISENQKIGWTPAHVRDGRFGKWLEGAREWAVSRLRYWGAPLPVWRNEDGDIKVISSLKELSELSKAKPKNTYYVIRHGQSVYNTKKLLDSKGVEENVLTEAGREKIASQRDAFKELNVDVVYTSPLPRTKETAHILTEGTELVPVIDERLREFAFGEFEGKTTEEFHARESLHLHLNEKAEGGESFRSLAHRFMQLVSECEENHEGKTILFVTHGSNAYMGRAEAELWTDEEIINGNEELTVHNGELIKVTPALVPRDSSGAVNLHRPHIDSVVIEINGKDYKRIPDVFDCWYESGSMPFAQLHYPFENKDLFEKDFPADFIAEGLDQTRGWFYSLINLGVGVFGKSPYKNVIVSGLVLAGDGQKMSKSEKNYTDPMELVEKYGADAIRYFLLSSSVVKGESVEFHDKGVEDVYKKVIGRFENVVSLYLMNKEEGVVPSNTSQHVLDVWMLARVEEVLNAVSLGYESYKLDEATRPIEGLVDDLSVWYTRRSRDRLKGLEGESAKRDSLATLSYTLLEMSKMMAPVMPFMAERVYKVVGGQKESVHLELWTKAKELSENDKTVLQRMERTRGVVSLLLMERTKAKIAVRQPLQKAEVKDGTIFADIVADEVNVKEVTVTESLGSEVTLDTLLTDELVREGDVRTFIRAVQDLRKEKGLNQKDVVSLKTTFVLSEEEKKEVMKICSLSAVEEGVEGGKEVSLSQGACGISL